MRKVDRVISLKILCFTCWFIDQKKRRFCFYPGQTNSSVYMENDPAIVSAKRVASPTQSESTRVEIFVGTYKRICYQHRNLMLSELNSPSPLTRVEFDPGQTVHINTS